MEDRCFKSTNLASFSLIFFLLLHTACPNLSGSMTSFVCNHQPLPLSPVHKEIPSSLIQRSRQGPDCTTAITRAFFLQDVVDLGTEVGLTVWVPQPFLSVQRERGSGGILLFLGSSVAQIHS